MQQSLVFQSLFKAPGLAAWPAGCCENGSLVLNKSLPSLEVFSGFLSLSLILGTPPPNSFFSNRTLCSFAFSGLLQIIEDLLGLKWGDGRPFQLPPCPSLSPRRCPWGTLESEKAYLETSGLWNPNSQSRCSFASRSWSPERQIAMYSSIWYLCWAAHLVHPSRWHWPKFPTQLSSLTQLLILPVSLVPRDHAFPLTLMSLVFVRHPPRGQETDSGEPWNQRNPGQAISNSECSGHPPRLCSDFGCSLESSHYITKKSTIKSIQTHTHTYIKKICFLITKGIYCHNIRRTVSNTENYKK